MANEYFYEPFFGKQMNIIRKIGVIFGAIVISMYGYGQETYPDCTNAKEIVVPLTSDFLLKVPDEIYYQPEDQFTYWYKIVAASAVKVSYKIEEISNNDSYDVLIYKFKGKNFCNEIVLRRQKPVSNKMEGTLKLKKNEVYYLGLLHLNGNGCGHILSISTGDNSTSIKAVQSECIEEVLERIAQLEQVDEQSEIPLKNLQVEGSVINANTGKNIEASVNIMDGEEESQFISSVNNGFVLTNSIDDKIIVSIEKMGYKPFLDTITIDSSEFKIKLVPIDVGEKLVMYKISFHPNTYALKETSKGELEELNKFMLENSDYSFQIQGHTNGNRYVKESKGYEGLGEEWNFNGTAKKLSKLRAEKIKSYMMDNGVREERLETVGYGGDNMIIARPINMKEAIQNIRVEVVVIQNQ